MQSPDHPELRFVQAKGYARGRPDGAPLWIVVHDMEAGEHSTRAESTAAYFASPSDGRSVSSHYCADNDSVVQCVLLRDVAWTVGNRPGNNRGINWEFAGFARQTREQWLDEFGLAMFRQAAPIIRADAETYDIPLTRCSVADLKAGRKGITSHNDLRLAYGVTTHTDPGPNFPWDVFLQILEDDMAADDVWLYDPNDIKTGVRNQPFSADATTNPTVQARYALERAWYYGHYAYERVGKVAAVVDAVAKDVAEMKARPPVDPVVIAAAIDAALRDPSVLAALATAINEDQARRLAE